MAKLIPDVRLSRAKNAQHDEYMRDVLENAQVCPGIQLYLSAQLAEFRAAVEALHAMVSRPLRWELTPAITEADQKLDKALSALRALMKASLENPDPQAAEAAKVALRMSEIDKITGQEQYDEESGKISAMLTTLLGEYEEQTRAAGIMPFVLQLKERNDRLCELLQERDLAQGEAGPHNTTELRTEADAKYRKLVLDVNSVANCIDLGIIASPQGNPFTIFIDYMIGHIDRFHREVLRAASTGNPEMDGGESAPGAPSNPSTPNDPSDPSNPSNPTDPADPSLVTALFTFHSGQVEEILAAAGAALAAPTNTAGYLWTPDVPAVMPAANIRFVEVPEGVQLYQLVWYLPDGNPLEWFELPAGMTIPPAPPAPEGYEWHPYPDVMPARDMDIIPNPVRS